MVGKFSRNERAESSFSSEHSPLAVVEWLTSERGDKDVVSQSSHTESQVTFNWDGPETEMNRDYQLASSYDPLVMQLQ